VTRRGPPDPHHLLARLPDPCHGAGVCLSPQTESCRICVRHKQTAPVSMYAAPLVGVTATACPATAREGPSRDSVRVQGRCASPVRCASPLRQSSPVQSPGTRPAPLHPLEPDPCPVCTPCVSRLQCPRLSSLAAHLLLLTIPHDNQKDRELLTETQHAGFLV
jgi:hypothetical protein